MRCDVCEHQMIGSQEPGSSGSFVEAWSCPWCHADTVLGDEHFEILRPPYQELEYRWDRAYSYEMLDSVGHAYAGRHQTLCGITHPDISPSPWPWSPLRDGACQDCLAAARVIDERWPADRRGLSDRQSTRAEQVPSMAAGKAATDGVQAPDDQLGRPDLALRHDEADRYVQPPGATGSVEPVDTPFPAFWYGTHLGIYRPWTWESPAQRPMSQLPTLDPGAFTGDFSWMGGCGEPISLRTAQLVHLAAELNDAGLALPQDFATLATGTIPHTALDRSGTFMELTGPLINPAEPRARMVGFAYQEGMSWYLYLRPNGESFIVHSGGHFEPSGTGSGVGLVEGSEAEKTIFWCAPSAEVFTYRFRAETLLARAIRDRQRARDLPAGLRAYLAAALQLKVS